MSSFGANFENLENKILNIPGNIVDGMRRNNIANSIVLLLLLYVILAAPTMSPSVVKLFNNNFFKLVYIFLVVCLVSQNPVLSLGVAVVLLVVLNKLLEPKPVPVIPESNRVNKPIVLQPGAVVTTTASGQTVVLPPSMMAQNNVENFTLFNDLGLAGTQYKNVDLSGTMFDGRAHKNANLSGATNNVEHFSIMNGLYPTTTPGQIGSGQQTANDVLKTVLGDGGQQTANDVLKTVLGDGGQQTANNLSYGGVIKTADMDTGPQEIANLSDATNMRNMNQRANTNLSGATNMNQDDINIRNMNQRANTNLSGATNMNQGDINMRNIKQSANTNLSGATNMNQGDINMRNIKQSANTNQLGSANMAQGDINMRNIKQSANLSGATKKDEVEMSCRLVCDNKRVEKFENEDTNDRLTQRQQMMNLWQANQNKDPAVLPGYATAEQQNDACASADVNSQCDILGTNKYPSTSHARVTVNNNPCPEDGEVHGVYENVDKEYASVTTIDEKPLEHNL